MHSFQDRFAYQIFRLNDAFGFRHNFLDHGLRNHEHTVAIAHDVVSRLNVDAADVDRHVVRDEPPPPHDVDGRLVTRENWEFEFADVVGVARAAINYSPAGAAKLRRFTR